MMSKYQEALNNVIETYQELERRVGNNPDKVKDFDDVVTLQELIDKETPSFENSCNAIFDEKLLYEAIDWKCQLLNKYCHKKYKVYLCNGYPCISIGHEKIKIHQLLGEYLFGKIRNGYVIHHKDGNKLNNRKENLQYISNVLHAQIHHKGKEYTPSIKAIKKARKTIYREEITKEKCEQLRKQGLTINQIAQKLNCCVNTINRRLGMKDYTTKNNVLDWGDTDE